MSFRAAAIIPAGGLGRRMGLDLPKQFCRLAGEPLLVHVVRAFLQVSQIRKIILAVPDSHWSLAEGILAEAGLTDRIDLVTGGLRRQDSVQAGLDVLGSEIDLVAVHDGARPLVPPELIRACLQEAWRHGAALAAVPVKDTLKRVDGQGEVRATIDRESLWQAQTPQVARIDILRRAFDLARKDGYTGTDESALLERIGCSVTVVPGSEKNLKITRPEDLVMAESILQAEKGEKENGLRIGHGYDVHRLVPGRELILGGVSIPFSLGLLGHSDADVLIHALCDAILGALGQGDIGRHFPDTSQEFAGIASTVLLARVMDMVRERGLAVISGDVTIIAQAPKLAAFLSAMRGRLAQLCELSDDRMNVKATTTEGLGFAGRGEGIAAHAVVMLAPA